MGIEERNKVALGTLVSQLGIENATGYLLIVDLPDDVHRLCNIPTKSSEIIENMLALTMTLKEMIAKSSRKHASEIVVHLMVATVAAVASGSDDKEGICRALNTISDIIRDTPESQVRNIGMNALVHMIRQYISSESVDEEPCSDGDAPVELD